MLRHIDVATSSVWILALTLPISKPFGIKVFAPILTKAEKWEIEDKF